MVARANYLAADRPDIAFAVKELSRRMSCPRKKYQKAFKKLGRYPLGRPRMVMKFDRQDHKPEIVTWVDSDFAGC